MDGRAIVRRVATGVGIALLLSTGGPFFSTCSGGCGGYEGLVMDTLRVCPKARELLGDDVRESYVGCACGQMETGGGTGNASWSVPVSGSRGRGTYEYVLEQHAGRWQVMAATLHAQDQNVDVLGCSSALPVSAGSSGNPGSATALATQCDANTAAACLALGAMYEEGKGVPRDEALARKLYDRACQGGLATGCALRDRDRDRDRAGGGDGAATSK
jgi:hypothetical protein